LDEAIQIAEDNPVFEDGTGARIEVRPVKVMEGIKMKIMLVQAGESKKP
jgi:hypothetical protein